MTSVTCRLCSAALEHVFVDLGSSPLSNSYLKAEQLQEMEPFFPLKVFVCARCWLVQLPAVTLPEAIFTDYAYFSSYSESWLRHARNYVEQMIALRSLSSSSHVMELASNDGYLLQYFVERGIPVLGVEPAANVAKTATEKGIPTRVAFFGRQTARELAEEGRHADLLLGNNVLAHVPDIHDFIGGMKIILKPEGILTMEFPHLMNLIDYNQFDTIYHEHFSYLSFIAAERAFADHGLVLYDVEELSTHGGSLRIYGRHVEHTELPVTQRAQALRQRERELGLDRLETYIDFGRKVEATKRDLLEFLIAAKREGKQVVGYGAPAKGNTLLNYCGVRQDFLDYTVDRNPHKQGLFLPGTHVPIHAPERIAETKPDYVIILPWNLKDEVIAQMAHVREWGGKFIVPIPNVEEVGDDLHGN